MASHEDRGNRRRRRWTRSAERPRPGPLKIINLDDEDKVSSERIGEPCERSQGQGSTNTRGRSGRGRCDNQRGRGGRGRSRGGSRGGANNSSTGGCSMKRYSSLDTLNSTLNREGLPGESQTAKSSHQSRFKTPRIFGYKKLKELSEKENVDDILLEMLSEQSGFHNLLKDKDMKPDWSRLLLHILAKSCSSQKRQNRLELIRLIVQENFTSLINVLLSRIVAKQINISEENLELLIQDVCKVLKEVMKCMPDEVHSTTSVVLMLTAISQDPHFNLQGNQTVIDMISDISSTKEIIIKDNEERMRLSNMQPGKRRHYKDMENMLPPDDYRELPILPDLKDLQFNDKPFLRKNKVDGSYDNLHHYLDVQFRLLREDYVQPLRNGIMEYRQGKKNPQQRLQDIRLYHDVRVIRPNCSNSGILHVLQFDVSRMKNMRWESSRRLLHGSLVCLSQDDFETILFATVTNRDVKELSKGFIEVQFQSNFHRVFEIKPSDEFVMAETTAYFEAYRHILRGLQEIDDDLPMQRYIVECKRALKPPKYLQQGIQYFDLSPITGSECSVPIINTRKWPSAEELKLDNSQYRALQIALTKEMALIQGPPGTGKTFVGLKIMQILLHNSDVWKRSSYDIAEGNSSNSILVVCYTNHALDQFLEGVSEFCDSIVRIGGRCSNPSLENFMLKNLRKESRANRKIPRHIWERKSDCKRRLHDLEEKISDVSTKLEASRMGIIHEKELELHIREDMLESLMMMTRGEETQSAIFEWLVRDLNQLGLPLTSGTGDSTVKTFESSTNTKWIDMIISGPSFEMDVEWKSGEDLWDKNLVERVYLYKNWIASYKQNKQKSIEDINQDIQGITGRRKVSAEDQKTLQLQQKRIQNLTADIFKAESQILPENILKFGLRLELRKQLDQLLAHNTHQSEGCSVVEHWLHAKDVADEQGLVGEALGIIVSLTTTIDTVEDADAIEMERIIDEEDEINTRKQGQKVMLSEAIDKLVISFNDPEISGDDQWQEIGWKTKGSVKKTKEKLQKMLQHSKPMSEKEEDKLLSNVWTLDVNTRFSLYKLWLNRYQDYLSESIQESVKEYTQVCALHQEVMDSEDIDIISGSKVIAMTTTGAAKYRNILRAVNPKIIVVEEAAEVLESHIVTTINSNCEHLILIGDHKQLRPTPTVYNLAVNYNLEFSLFERMIKNDMNFVTLELQHRMRPEISAQMLHIYPDLKDHRSVFGMKDVLGIDRNMFFIDHKCEETFHGETKSRSNTHEAEFISSLCKYILYQGYKPTQITVLATYTGQVFALKKEMPRNVFEGVRVTAVDNYQGEENDIILLSLVRSNSDSNVGFLKTDNRVCVALSRAKMGFFVIGNFKLLSSQSNLWANIVKTLEDNEAVGSYITLRCQNHADKVIKASSKTDFHKAPNGGCDQPCNGRLPCGHVCEQFCHILDKDHKSYRCQKQCGKTICSKGHRCTKMCYKKCGQCEAKVVKQIPMCGHMQEGFCYQDPHLYKCASKCEEILSCGHKCSGNCGQCTANNIHQLQCQELIQRTLLCGHTIMCKCFQEKDDVICTNACKATLDCGHYCSGTCGKCFQGRLHLPCFNKCTKMLICGHKCNQQCGEPCPPCDKKCGVNCEHSKCSLKCGQPCRSCMEPCQWICDHHKCGKLCHEMCDRIPCDLPCPKTLGCGHSCTGLCGEDCPEVCFICNKDKTKEIFQNTTADTKFLVLKDCKHILEKNYLDNWMRINDQNTSKVSKFEVKKCPKCTKPIYNSNRYGNIVKATRGHIESVKTQLIGSQRKIVTNCQEVKSMLDELKALDQDSTNKLMQQIETPKTQLTLTSLQVVKIQISMLKRVLDKIVTLSRIQTASYQKMSLQIHRALQLMRQWIMESKYKPNKTDIKSKRRQTFTPQEIDEGQDEILRLSYMAEALLCADINSREGKKSIATKYIDIIEILQNDRAMMSDLDVKLKRVFKSLHLQGSSDCPGVDENRCVPQSIRLNDFAQRGQWLKCNEGNHLFHGNLQSITLCPFCPKSRKEQSSVTPASGTTTNCLQIAEKVIRQGVLNENNEERAPKVFLSKEQPEQEVKTAHAMLHDKRTKKTVVTKATESRLGLSDSEVSFDLQPRTNVAITEKDSTSMLNSAGYMSTGRSGDCFSRLSEDSRNVKDLVEMFDVVESERSIAKFSVPALKESAQVRDKIDGVYSKPEALNHDSSNKQKMKTLAWTDPTPVSRVREKISYSRDVLLQLRNSPLTEEPPPNIPEDVKLTIYRGIEKNDHSSNISGEVEPVLGVSDVSSNVNPITTVTSPSIPEVTSSKTKDEMMRYRLSLPVSYYTAQPVEQDVPLKTCDGTVNWKTPAAMANNKSMNEGHTKQVEEYAYKSSTTLGSGDKYTLFEAQRIPKTTERVSQRNEVPLSPSYLNKINQKEDYMDQEHLATEDDHSFDISQEVKPVHGTRENTSNVNPVTAFNSLSISKDTRSKTKDKMTTYRPGSQVSNSAEQPLETDVPLKTSDGTVNWKTSATMAHYRTKDKDDTKQEEDYKYRRITTSENEDKYTAGKAQRLPRPTERISQRHEAFLSTSYRKQDNTDTEYPVTGAKDSFYGYDNKESKREPPQKLPQATKMRFQCLEPGCTELEAPGKSGRCLEHFTERESTIMSKIKTWFGK